MSIEEFKELWVEAGFPLEDLVFNYYKLEFDNDDYIIGYYAVVEGAEYDFYGQMALFYDITEGWYKFIQDQSECGGSFYLDEERKAKIIAEREAEAQKPTQLDKVESQTFYTAMVTDTLLEDSEM